MERSIGQKIMQIEGLVGTSAVNEREEKFIEDVSRITEGGKRTTMLTGPQVEWIGRIWKRHFA